MKPGIGAALLGVACGSPTSLHALDCGLHGSNDLRVACRVRLDHPAPLVATLEIPGEAPRRVERDAALRHDVVFWDLPTSTSVSWALKSGPFQRDGVVRTGEGPPTSRMMVDETLILPAQERRPARMLFPWGCGDGPEFIVVTDQDWNLRWYEQVPRGSVRAIAVSDTGTFLVMVGRRFVREYRPDGTRVEYGPEFGLDLPIHHDVVSRNGQTLVLNAREVQGSLGQTYISDGVYEIVDGRAHDVWNLTDHLDPTGLPEPPVPGYWQVRLRGIDFGHANSIDVDERGWWLISFKHLDTVMAVVGTPGAPDRGRIAWELVGGPRGVAEAPLNVTSASGLEPGFVSPHHAQWLGDGRISVFDSQEGFPSRVVEIKIDEAAGTAHYLHEWPTDLQCPVQSSGFLLNDGSMWLTCTSQRRLLGFDRFRELRSSARLACPEEIERLPPPLVRVVPLDAFGNGRLDQP